jgi:hypothetical protein
MSESTYHESMYQFCRAMNGVFGELYLRSPTDEDTRWLLSINEARRFPGVIGSIHCMRALAVEELSICMEGSIHVHAEGCTIVSLAWPVLTMTSMCSTSLSVQPAYGRHCSKGEL